jgi:hypothetical protein
VRPVLPGAAERPGSDTRIISRQWSVWNSNTAVVGAGAGPLEVVENAGLAVMATVTRCL